MSIRAFCNSRHDSRRNSHLAIAAFFCLALMMPRAATAEPAGSHAKATAPKAPSTANRVLPPPGAEFDCTGAVDAKDLLTLVERQYEHINDLAADFRQSSYFLGTDEHKQSGGKVYFLRPGKMDWVYAAPDEQRFVSDGESVWWYQPSLQQANVRTLSQSFVTDVPVSFLLGVGKLHEEFRLESACASSGGVVLTLLPQRPSASLDKFLLLVDPADHSPRGARILDVGGNETSIVFSGIALNKGVEGKRFHFDVPKGTDVIDERTAKQPDQVEPKKRVRAE